MTELITISTISTISNNQLKLVTLNGWLYNKRGSGKILFLQIRDGTGFIQAIVNQNDVSSAEFELAKHLSQESSISITGTINKDSRAPFCGHEIWVSQIEIISHSQDYPIAKKSHGDAFLMSNRHLWMRSIKQHSILKIRASLIRAIRDYFDSHGFLLIDSPIFTPNACEGTSTLFETEWFNGQKVYLSQSGQLYQEAACAAFGKTYCFGPVFRAEKSKTRRHLNEFWMVEPEAAFMDLEGTIQLAEDFLCYTVERILNIHEKDLTNILERDLTIVKNTRKPFPRILYTDACDKIAKLGLEIKTGDDFGSPHETELTKQYDKPLIVTHFPSKIKAFYMKKDELNPDFAKCMDLLSPEGYGEIIGGGQRENNEQILMIEMQNHGLNLKDFEWFLDLRRYGSVPHSGFGMGLERCLAWICGLHHVRETIPFARTLDRMNP